MKIVLDRDLYKYATKWDWIRKKQKKKHNMICLVMGIMEFIKPSYEFLKKIKGIV
jgi:hypothetical protein